MTITENRLVTLAYRLTNSKGELLNPDQEPLIYLQGGHGHVFKKVEETLEGKHIGESVSITLSPDEAFGDYDAALVVKEPLDELPEGITVKMEIETYEEGLDEATVYTVTEIKDGYALLDANHPMAGDSLTFEGTVEDIQELGEEAIREILAHHHH
ncbi:MAG: peptidylprolyl isomerase [Helicobacteraceae bacterium]|jgi:FKBP-type peptidyl-prolyl cis-trans isomerase SlyD|nr:peptidylprolyl isomerase [Helicobacteraceae bacterium]